MKMFETYQSPYSWRYGSPEMRRIWSEYNKRLIWRQLWLALAEIQYDYGIVDQLQVEDLREHLNEINIAHSLEIENEIGHDLMAELRTYAQQCKVGGGILHLGMTSMDIIDNADILRVKEALMIIVEKLQDLILSLATKVELWAKLPIIGFTHLQPAEPTTLGYRLSQYLQSLLLDYEDLKVFITKLRGKGLKGAVGTRASFKEVFINIDMDLIESSFAEKLGIDFFLVSSQTYPRVQDYRLLCCLAGIGATLYKFAFDLRLLQTPSIGEWMEPFGSSQVGSSAMPFKRNPINAEKIDSLARLLSQFPHVAWDNAAHSLLERTLDDSANRRSTIPESFLILDEILLTVTKIIEDLRIDMDAIQKNLSNYSVFAAQEKLLMSLSVKGADRQKMHEKLRIYSMEAWESIRKTGRNPLINQLTNDEEILRYLTKQEIIDNMSEGHNYYGDASELAIKLVNLTQSIVSEEFDTR